MAAPELNADATSAAGTVSNVEYHDLALAASYADDRIDIRSLKFNAFGGAIAGSATATIAKARPFEAKLNLDNIDLGKLLASQKAKAAGTVRGSLTGQIQISGSGIRIGQIKPTLRGGGKAVIQNGKLVGVNVAAQAMKKTKKIPGVGDLVSPDVIARHPELFASPDTDIRQASLSFTIEGPKIISHDIAIESPDYKILGDGSFDADKNIDLKAKLVIVKELSGELEANKHAVALLANKNGEIEIPVQIVGTLPKPDVLPDIQAIVETAAQGAFKGKAGKLLGGVLGKKGKERRRRHLGRRLGVAAGEAVSLTLRSHARAPVLQPNRQLLTNSTAPPWRRRRPDAGRPRETPRSTATFPDTRARLS